MYEKNDDSYTKYLIDYSKSIFQLFDSSYKRKKFYENKIGFIKPEEVVFKSEVSADPVNEELLVEERYGYYIPFSKSLKKTIENLPPSLNLNYQNDTNTLKTDCFDGIYVKNMLKQVKGNTKLAILIYTDDIELTNPVGANRTKHKLSNIRITFYF